MGMLVLSRKQGEQIVIPGCGATVTVLGVEGKRIRLGITAPRDVGIHRGELLTKRTFDARAARDEHAVAACQSGSAPVRVLIADTNENLSNGFCEQLGSCGCEVAVATSGVECLQKLRERAPDVLVLEPSIPWGGGDGVLAVMHEQFDVPRVPVLVLTYGRDRGVLYRLAPYPIDDFQRKPISGRRLAERLHAIARGTPLEAKSVSAAH